MHDPARGDRRVVTRRYAPKTKNGCITCKIRRVKCDETKPSCNRCTSTKRKCDGYLLPNAAETKQNASSEILRPSLNLDVSCDALEKRTFHFFRERTVPCVSGYFQDHLWDRMVLQVSHSEPAVRYAINALGAQHEMDMLRRSAKKSGAVTTTDCRTTFPEVQYTKALAAMQRLLKADQVPINVVLICSLALVHFESLRECFVPALVHAENAIRLLQSSTTLNTESIEPSLVRAMVRLDVQGSMYLGMRVPGLPFYTSSTDNTLPESFDSLVQARDLITAWSCRMYHFMRTKADDYKFRELGAAPLELLAKAQELERVFMKLDYLLLDFMHRPTVRLTAQELHGLNMLRCRVKVDRILSACCLYTEASMFDMFLDQFEEMLAICIYVLKSDDPESRLFTVSLDEGLLFPLWFTAAHCRDSHMRRTALRMLKQLPSGSNVWHVEAMTRSAEKCIEFEEAGCGKESPKCEDIPEWRRIHSAGLDGLEVSTAKNEVTVYMRTRPNGIDGEWAEYQDKIYCDWGNKNTEHISGTFRSGAGLDEGSQRAINELKLPLLGQRTDPPATGLVNAHTGKWGPGMKLWMECTEPQKLRMIEGNLKVTSWAVHDCVGTSCL